MTASTEILLIFICLLLSAFFSGSETALLRMRAHQMQSDLDSSNALSALAAKRLLQSTSKLLVTILLGNNITNILAATIASALAVEALGPERGIVVSTVVLTVFVLVFCEVLPKAVAAQNPRRVSYAVALPLYLIHRLARPLHWLFDRVIDPVVRRLANPSDERGSGEEEVLELARKLRADPRQGTAAGLLGNVARAVDRTVVEVMTPRTEIVSVDRDIAPKDLLDVMLGDRYTRLPVHKGSIDDMIGFVHFKDVVGLTRAGGTDLSEILKPLAQVPERKPILDILAVMQRDAVPLAVIKDEFGVTVGLVSQEDVLEEFVGEIRDEFDDAELDLIRRLSKDRYAVRGSTSVLDFNRTTGWTLKGEPGETVGGLAFNALGKAPTRGDKVVVDGHELIVTACKGTHIKEVRIRRTEDAEQQPALDDGPIGG